MSASQLQAFEAFRARDVDSLAHSIESVLGGKLMQLQAGSEFDVRAFRYGLASSALWYCGYGMPIRIQDEQSLMSSAVRSPWATPSAA